MQATENCWLAHGINNNNQRFASFEFCSRYDRRIRIGKFGCSISMLNREEQTVIYYKFNI